MIIVLGMAGSGKSTQGQILAEKNGWKWISTGQVLRETGEFEELLKTGALVDTATIHDLMGKRFDQAREAGEELVLDGMPRNIEQAQWLVDNYKDDIEKVIYVEVPKDELVNRLMKRGRADDTEEAIKQRFEIGEQNIYSILSLLKANDISVATVDGTGPIEPITKRIEDVLNG